ncbi:MAG: TonB-dependent receptor [Caulobacteraceae bacterium]
MSRHRLLTGSSSIIALLGVAGACIASGAHAQTTVSSVVVEGDRLTASAAAITTQPLDAIQPTSVISQSFIQNNINLTSNYDDIVKFSPSVSSVGPNGPGLMENQSLTIRGFQDGQYNLTIDGIAWGDSNDFTHHSTSYVMSHDLGQVSVDRGPGTAETLGDATFGGTIGLQTKDPLDRQTETAYGSIGSFGTYLGGGQIDTGAIDQLNGAKAMVDVEHLQSDGFLSNAGQNRTNVFAKTIIPVAPNTTVTIAGMYNQIQQSVPIGATLAEMAQFGYNYALNANPSSQSFFGYNQDKIHTDLAYIGVHSIVGPGIVVDNKVYTYAYYHQGFNGEDVNGETPNGTFYSPTDVPGQHLINNYQSFGDIARASKDFGLVQVNGGFWLDHQVNHRDLLEIDDSLGGALNPPNDTAIDREQRDSLLTFQPYVQLDIKPLPGLVISPGFKYDYFNRSLEAPVNQGTGQPLDFSRTFDKLVPSVVAHYQVDSQWSVYAQYAEGFLAPNLNTFFTVNPGLSTTLQPETTNNYQAGGSYHTNRLTLSADVYLIDFDNEIQSHTVAGQQIFFNGGGVTYKGVEAEGDYRVWGPFNLYGNVSFNSSKDKDTGGAVANSPRSTAAGGISYEAHSVYVALLAKYTGARYGQDPQEFPLRPYTTAQLSLGYTIPASGTRPEIKIKGLIDNLFDTRGQDLLAGTTVADGTPLYWNIVPRNFELSVSAAF